MSSLFMAVSTWFPRDLRQARAHHVVFVYGCESTWFPRNLRQACAHHVVFVYGCEHVVSSKFAASSRPSCRLCIWLWEHVVSSKFAANSRSSCRLCLCGFLPPNNLLSVSTRGRAAKLFGLLTDRLGEEHRGWAGTGSGPEGGQLSNCFRFFV